MIVEILALGLEHLVAVARRLVGGKYGIDFRIVLSSDRGGTD